MFKRHMRDYTHDEFVEIVKNSDENGILELSNEHGGYPVFFRMSRDPRIAHIPFMQTGAALIVRNENGEILLQKRSDNKKWGLPGGCKDLGERLEDTAVRELFEETGIKLEVEDLILIAALSGERRRKTYPNGDIVDNVSIIYLVDVSSEEIDIKMNDESIELRFFSIDNLPPTEFIHDDDEIDAYIEYLNRKTRTLNKQSLI